MKPDPGRAALLRATFQEGFLGIARRLWPQLNLVLAVDSGSNQIYGEMLREHYCKGVSFYSPFYAATEGRKQEFVVAVCGAILSAFVILNAMAASVIVCVFVPMSFS